MDISGVSKEYLNKIIRSFCYRRGSRIGVILGGIYGVYYVSASMHSILTGRYPGTAGTFLAVLLGGMIMVIVFGSLVMYTLTHAWVLFRLTTARTNDEQLRVIFELEGIDDELED